MATPTPLTTSSNPHLKPFPKLTSEERKRLHQEIGPLTLDLTYTCISHALRTALPPLSIEDLLEKLLEKRKLLYRDDVLNGDLNDSERMVQMQENEDWIKV